MNVLTNSFSAIYSAHLSILSSTSDLYLVKMGNESLIKFWEVYKKKARKEFEDIIYQLKNYEVFIRCSTPDFVVIKRKVIESHIPLNDENFFHKIKKIYRKIVNKCNPSDVVSFISLKTSNRPDRRYQILYEANITKYASKYIHDDEYLLRFDVIGNSNDSDAQVFEAPFLYSLKKLGLNDLNEQLESIEYPVIGSGKKISTGVEMDSY